MRPLLLLWAKLGHDAYEQRHPVICHLADVAAVAWQLWNHVQRDAPKQRLSSSLGLAPEAAGRWLAFWAGAHDIGKVAACFQDKDRSGAARTALEREHFDFLHTADVPHGTISTCVLAEALADPADWPAVPAELARRIAVAVGGHHGVFPAIADWHNLGEATLGNDRWRQARREVLAQLARHLGVDALQPPTPPPEDQHAFFLFLAGLTSVADWVGSNTRFFESATGKVELADYLGSVAGKAEKALKDLGWLGWSPADSAPRTFGGLFPKIETPRPLQSAVERLSPSPGLVLVEAPMGEGKTEAALYLADFWTHAAGHQGLYLALPTQATSNQMFTRVRKFLARRYPEDRVNLHLLHGHALLSEAYGELRDRAEVYDRDDAPGAVVAESWFAQNKKHGLLAPFAVGTIDQALLAVLQTKHVFVRLFGLAGKTVVLDEVHAYDAYVSALLERLLAWLAALGCPVVLLSATLPRDKRLGLLKAYAGPDAAVTDDRPYPRLTLAQPGDPPVVRVEHVPASAEVGKTVRLDWRDDDPVRLAADLATALAAGGCAVVIRNTVGLAQQTYLALAAALKPSGVEVELFHARFPFGRRLEIEEGVLRRYGKPVDNPLRPVKSVLVATQVIEQSLDLDFDLLVSDVAPVDLVLQRAGRLWRHNKRTRPPGIGGPAVWLLKPAEKDGVPDFGPSEWVYQRYVLLRSFLALARRSEVKLPDDIEDLIEAVYGRGALAIPDPEAWRQALAGAETAMKDEWKKDRQAAATFLVKPPDGEDDVLLDFNQQLEDDNPDVPRDRQAFTRLAEPSVALVVLYDHGGRLSLDPAGQRPIDLGREPKLKDARALLGNAVTVQHKGCVFHYVGKPPEKKWKDNGLLRFHRVVKVGPDGRSFLPEEYPLTVDRELGVLFTRAEDKET
jgi:CRISPR-associated endonuclease/helicase Cas3